jgi:hypothetical protein
MTPDVTLELVVRREKNTRSLASGLLPPRSETAPAAKDVLPPPGGARLTTHPPPLVALPRRGGRQCVLSEGKGEPAPGRPSVHHET